VVDVAISFDGGQWSAEAFRFRYKNRFNIFGILPIVLIYAMVIAALAVCIWRGAGMMRPVEDAAESQPFLGTVAGEGAGVVKKRGARRRGRP
jgi:hypothetical protein